MGTSTAPPLPSIPTIVEELQNAFDHGKTRPLEWRTKQMRQLWALIDENEHALQQALNADVGKSILDAQIYELGGFKNEILHMLQNFEGWLKPETPAVPDMFQAYKPSITKEPKGVVLIIAPWNYPVVLLLLPLLGAIAAGNCAILKPSELAPQVTATLADLVPRYLDRECFRVVQGGKEVSEELLEHPLGHIFFTGSPSVGKSIMAAASKHLTPVNLELGGKSPAIVMESANIAQAAKRIAWGKFLNAGQTCVAPDYALVHASVLPLFLQEITHVMEATYAYDHHSSHSARYRIVNSHHYDRLASLLASTKGTTFHRTAPPHRPTLSMPPTVVTDLQATDPLFQSELFGPILPILTFSTLSDLTATVRGIDPMPLATYVFTSSSPASSSAAEIEHLNARIPSGTTCVNDVMGHLGVTSLPLSGRGSSGFGAYRGKESIECFSAKRTVVDVPTSEEFEAMLGFRYPGGDDGGKYRMWKDGMEGKRDW
ncbi:MAG: hypothetical protein Q9206_000096 [Seirophora lacunosa]|nr:MAG: hypothetical protein LQ344_001006 [Seirophora lacunosa]